MILTVKLPSATYTMRMEGNSMTVDCAYMGVDKDGNPKEKTNTLGYYGPAQVDLAINRIIAEELTQNDERVNLREFLRVYKGIQEIIKPQLAELKEQVIKNNQK